MTVNLSVTNESDITNDLKNAISFLDSRGGGALNIPYRKSGYNIAIGDIYLKNNITINGNGNDIYIQSSPVNRILFHLVKVQNISLKDLNIISTNDQVRKNGRANLGSNVYALNIAGDDINLSNLYFESLEAGIWANSPTVSNRIIADNLRSYRTKQPIFMRYVSDSYFTNLDMDCIDSVGHDHQIYLNGAVKNTFFDRLNFKNGFGPAIITKTDNTSVPINTNIYFSNVNIENTCGIALWQMDAAYLNNIYVTENPDAAVPIFKEYGIRFAGNNIFANNIFVKGFNNPLSFSDCTNVKVSVGEFKEGSVRGVEIVNGVDILLDSLTFKLKPKAFSMYFSQYDIDNKVTFNNCQFIYDTKPTTFPISIRATNERTIIQNCQFINKATESLSAVMYNLTPSKVIAKNNYFKGFTAFKSTLDTATEEYNNIDLNAW